VHGLRRDPKGARMTIEPWTCWLPFPPTVNNLFAHGLVKGRIRRFPSRQYKAWRLEAVTRIRAAWRTRPPWPVPVVIKLELVPADRRPRDASNYVKPVEDALVEARVLVDDSQAYVKAVMPYWAEPQKTSGVIVTIRPARIEVPKQAQLEMFA
jgi:Holliday junction resolvase RusA-like endonuclease